MDFVWPGMLILLGLVPALAGLLLWQQRRRRQALARSGGFGRLVQAPGRGLGRRRYLPLALFLSALAVLLFALARPRAVVSMPRLEGTVLLAFDVSGSMAAEDLQPTRMEAAKVAAGDFVQRLPPAVQAGVVAFSEGGLYIQPPTGDAEALLATITRLEPQRGTSLGQGILTAVRSITGGGEAAGEQPGAGDPNAAPEVFEPWDIPPELEGAFDSAVIVLLSDGENNMEPDPREAAQIAARYGIRIYTVGVGSPAGITLTINGFTVHTQLDEAMLEEVAALTGGAYFRAENETELQEIYANLAPQLVVRPEKVEITALLAGAGILFLLAGGVLSLVWFGRVP